MDVLAKTYDREIRPYPGRVTLFRPTERRDMPGHAIDDTCGWTGLATGPFRVVDVVGDHLEILMEPHVATLAELIAAELSRPDGQRLRGRRGPHPRPSRGTSPPRAGEFAAP